VPLQCCAPAIPCPSTPPAPALPCPSITTIALAEGEVVVRPEVRRSPVPEKLCAQAILCPSNIVPQQNYTPVIL